MRSMTTFEFGDVVLVPFPFTDQTTSKKRPAVVVSSGGYHAHRDDLVTLGVTSRVRTPVTFGEALVEDWNAAGLRRPSMLKPVLTT